jgi:hypothetical protein
MSYQKKVGDLFFPELLVSYKFFVSLALRQKSAFLKKMDMILHGSMSLEIIRAEEGLLHDHQTVTVIVSHCDHMSLLFRNLQLVLRIKNK